ncbi:29 kDa ribonucleoprotein A, chloroplastic-like isoform X2 [Aristolochia californica]|uniref:29 kDa ribonucleoprotein A, chloroplastic-like isoform X2 n=1 Tax=Aristolochia californica TaxID=171875 RepID=UPI0035E252B8
MAGAASTSFPSMVAPKTQSYPRRRLGSFCLSASVSTRAHSFLSFPHPISLFPILLGPSPRRVSLSRISAVVDEEPVAEATLPEDDSKLEDVGDGLSPEDLEPIVRPCKLYVCNLPRRCDIAELQEIFKPFGTVQSVEVRDFSQVSRDPETGMSKGCGFVAMSSIPEGIAAIEALDGSDLGGREIRVSGSAMR